MPRFLLSETFFIPFIRVEEYIRCGKDKNIVDPDPNGLYTKRKRRRSGLSGASADQSHIDDESFKNVTYPENGWSTSLEKTIFNEKSELKNNVFHLIYCMSVLLQ